MNSLFTLKAWILQNAVVHNANETQTALNHHVYTLRFKSKPSWAYTGIVLHSGVFLHYLYFQCRKCSTVNLEHFLFLKQKLIENSC